MNTTNLTTLLAMLRAAEEHEGGMPAGAMKHIQKAIERVERKIASIDRVMAAAEMA